MDKHLKVAQLLSVLQIKNDMKHKTEHLDFSQCCFGAEIKRQNTQNKADDQNQDLILIMKIRFEQQS